MLIKQLRQVEAYHFFKKIILKGKQSHLIATSKKNNPSNNVSFFRLFIKFQGQSIDIHLTSFLHKSIYQIMQADLLL